MNKTKNIILILSLLICIFKLGNSQVVKFEKVYGGNDYDFGYSVAQTYDKGYVVTGATTGFGNGNSDAYILKTDSMGVAKWHKTFGGINIDQAYSIKETSDSGLVIIGFTNSFGAGGYDIYIVKTDSIGNVQWTKTYGGSNWDFAYSVEQTTDGGYIISGGTYTFGSGNEDMYLIKTNSIGDTLWTKTYGGLNEDEAKSVKQTSDGGYILTGFTKSFGDINGDIYTIKTDANGDSVWTYKYQGIKEDYSNDVIENKYGGYIIAGKSRLFTGNNYNGIVINVSTAGILNTIDTSFGGTNADDFITSIEQSIGGRFASLGNTYSYGYGLGTSDYLLHIQNPFTGFHGGTFGINKNENAYCIKNTTDGGYIICGNSTSYSNLDHIYLVKTDSNGLSSGTVNNVVIGINEISQKETRIKTYPIPASNNLFIDIPAMKDNSTIITITNLLGSEFLTQEYNNSNNPFNINTSDIPNGMYLITIRNKNFNSTERIIIQH